MLSLTLKQIHVVSAYTPPPNTRRQTYYDLYFPVNTPSSQGTAKLPPWRARWLLSVQKTTPGNLVGVNGVYNE